MSWGMDGSYARWKGNEKKGAVVVVLVGGGGEMVHGGREMGGWFDDVISLMFFDAVMVGSRCEGIQHF